MLQARAVLDRALVGPPIDRRLFGSFVEHLGRCIYTGIYEPDHPSATAEGFRSDVLALVRELGVTIVRYPGGNFVSGYHWEDGVGPLSERPRRLNLAWHQTEPNAFGLDEFVRWSRAAAIEPMLSLNLGTRGIEAALELLEYANHRGGTTVSERRIAHGAAEPYGIRIWCLGNELDGPWQLGHKSAAEYGRLAAETARAMRQYDPSLYLVAAGSSGIGMPTFGVWEATVLEEAYPYVDAISLHAYYEETDDDLVSFLASGVELERAIEAVVATSDAVGAKLRERKRIAVSFDEWGIWRGKLDPRAPRTDWDVAVPLGESTYTLADGVLAGGLLLALLKHADRVACACQSILVNAGAPIRTEPGGRAWRQTTFHPFCLTASHATGKVLHVPLETPSLETAKHGEVPALDAVATLDEARAALNVFLVNREAAEPVALRLDLGSWPGARLAGALVLAGDDPHATNTVNDPERVVPWPLDGASIEGRALTAILPPVSWTLLRLRTGAEETAG